MMDFLSIPEYRPRLLFFGVLGLFQLCAMLVFETL